MNETWWLSCVDPLPMCQHVQQEDYGRKHLLFSCACCRKVWPLMKDERSRQSVEVCERHADGQASTFELDAARLEARAAVPSKHPSKGVTVGTKPWRDVQTTRQVTLAAWLTASNSSILSVVRHCSVAEQRGLAETGWQCHLLRDIFGNPFRPVSADPSWLSSTVVGLAQAIYEERQLPGGQLDVGRLAILADALEEVGCNQTDILDHCRSQGPHVLGCWVVDLLLGKE